MNGPGGGEGRRASARRRRAARLGIAYLASAALNGAGIAAMSAAGLHLPHARPAHMPVVMAPLTSAEWEANRIREAPHPPVAAIPSRPAPKRIVELPPDAERDPLRHARPPARESRHLAERDQTVDEETVSRDTWHFARLLRVAQEPSRGSEGSGERGEHLLALPGQEGPGGGGGDPEVPSGPDAPPRIASASNATPTPAARIERPPALPPVESSLPLAGGEGGQRIQGRRISEQPPRSLPVPEGGPRWEGEEEAREGDETRLDASRFDAAAYWAAIRRRIESQWQERALATVRRYDPGEDGYFYIPRRILIGLALDASGHVRRAEILESSRIAFFDAVALAAVQDLEPYPEPPARALDADGAAKINVRFIWYPSLRKSLR